MIALRPLSFGALLFVANVAYEAYIVHPDPWWRAMSYIFSHWLSPPPPC